MSFRSDYLKKWVKLYSGSFFYKVSHREKETFFFILLWNEKNVIIKSTRLTEPLHLTTIIIADFLVDAKNVFSCKNKGNQYYSIWIFHKNNSISYIYYFELNLNANPFKSYWDTNFEHSLIQGIPDFRSLFSTICFALVEFVAKIFERLEIIKNSAQKCSQRKSNFPEYRSGSKLVRGSNSTYFVISETGNCTKQEAPCK